MVRAIGGRVAISAPAPVAAIRARRAAPKAPPKSPATGSCTGHVERGRDGLQPVVRARAAADGEQVVQPRAGRGQRIAAVADGEGDAFQHGAGAGRAVGRMFQPGEGARGWRHRSAASAHRPDRAGTGSCRGRAARRGSPVSLAASAPTSPHTSSAHRSRHRITPIWCQVSGSAWQKVWTAVSGSG